MGKIILYYKYVDITNPKALMDEQRALCQSLGLKGRIIIAHEGINGTLGGSAEAIEQYKKALNNHKLLSEIDFKESAGDADYFPRLSIKVKNEIVHFGVDTKKITAKDAGIYLSPEETHALIAHNKNLVLLDARNDYESKVGTFQNAIVPNIETFRELPQYIDNNLEQFKDKEVLMFCTGGVRCERATAYLKSKDVAKKVYHIQGGIHRYIEKYPDGYFKGKNYVFDGRITVKATDDILANCEHCAIPFDDYTNCVNASCNRQITVCPNCIKSYHNTCSKECLNKVQTASVNVRTIPHKVHLESRK